METLQVSERKLVLWRAEWMVCQEESRVELLIVSSQMVHDDSLSTMIMGVAHWGQRKQAGWAGDQLASAWVWGFGFSNSKR